MLSVVGQHGQLTLLLLQTRNSLVSSGLNPNMQSSVHRFMCLFLLLSTNKWQNGCTIFLFCKSFLEQPQLFSDCLPQESRQWQRLTPNSWLTLEGRLYAHRFDKRWIMAVTDTSFWFTGSESVTKCVTEEAWEALTAGPEERSCCRSVLLMELSYMTSRVDEVSGGKNLLGPGSVCHLLSFCKDRQRNRPCTPHFLNPPNCSVENNSVFLIFFFLVCSSLNKIKKHKNTCFCALTWHVIAVILTQICGRWWSCFTSYELITSF